MKTTTRKRKNAAQEPTEFSFSSDGARYAKKDEYIAGDVTFTIAAVDFDPKGSFTGEARWKVTVARDDTGAFEIITLPSNDKRDAQMRAAKNHITAKGAIASVRLAKHGSAFYFREARDT